jgi:hypothetical protein
MASYPPTRISAKQGIIAAKPRRTMGMDRNEKIGIGVKLLLKSDTNFPSAGRHGPFGKLTDHFGEIKPFIRKKREQKNAPIPLKATPLPAISTL